MPSVSHLPAFLVFLILTLALTWPLGLHLSDLVPFDLGDPLLSTWMLWWNARVTPFTERWWDGLAFFPAQDTLSFSDHRVGLGLIASPIIWLGGSPLAAHNVAFLLSFLLSATAAYALCFTLTRSRAAAFIGGLVFGFNPFRAGHLAHLELLSSYWLPIVLLALHKWVATPRLKWLLLLTVALLMQALTSGYYFVFSSVLIALWLIWFTPRNLSAKQYAALALALAIPLLVIAPILFAYHQAHAAMGLSRSILEIELFSADIAGLVTAPEPLALWSSPASWQRPEGALFPGLVAVMLVIAACMRPSSIYLEGRTFLAQATHDTPKSRAFPRSYARARSMLLVVAAIVGAIGLIPLLSGPVAFEVAGIPISVSGSHKPFSIATVFFAGWFLTSPRVRSAWRRQSPFAFYTLATIVMWLFALGPVGRLFGYRVLYLAPYSWLMLFPGFRDEFRAPARFAMLAVLTLSVAAALAFRRLFEGRARRVHTTAAAVLTLAIALESWIEPFPVAPAPPPLVIPAEVPPAAVVLELPRGIYPDLIAMYRSIMHGRPTVNGNSGYEPPHYGVLRSALEEGRIDVLPEIATYGDVAIFVPRDASGAELSRKLTSRAGARPVATTDRHDILLLPRAPGERAPRLDAHRFIRVQQLTSNSNPEALPAMEDGDRITVWGTDGPQRGGEEFTADLGEVADVNGVLLALGQRTTSFPRAIAIDVSPDGGAWTEVWQGETAARTVATAIVDPREIKVAFLFPPHRARYVRVRQTQQSPEFWAVAELRILGQ